MSKYELIKSRISERENVQLRLQVSETNFYSLKSCKNEFFIPNWLICRD